jgi:hypothetical protein
LPATRLLRICGRRSEALSVDAYNGEIKGIMEKIPI